MLTVTAYAKINLSLAVGQRGPDGMHPIVSVMQAVSLSDDVTVTPATSFSCTVDPEGAAPADETNLAVRAARAFATVHLDDDAAVSVAITKRIPSQAGLGGGSADAAATLIALNEATGGTVSRKALERLGAGIGADVPFCVRGGTAVATGVGDELTTIPCRTPLWWVIATSPFGCSTADVYARFDERGEGADLDLRGDPHELADALSRGDLDRIRMLLRNDLTEAACDLAPTLARKGKALKAAGAHAVVLCGSGSAWAGIAENAEEARVIAATATASGSFADVLVASSIAHGPRAV